MLIIRDEQLAALSLDARLDFERRLTKYLERELGPDFEPVRTYLSQTVDRVMKLGITREQDIAKYMLLMCRMVGFPSPGALPPPAMNLLLAHGVDGAKKVSDLEAWLNQQVQTGSKRA